MDHIVRFAKNKYQRELLIDCGKMSDIPAFVINHNPFVVAFHELFFITKGSGIFSLNDEQIPFQPGTILLLPPYKCRQWRSIKGQIDGYMLLFEEEFISTYFNDAFFLYRFHYFYNQSSPSYVHLPSQSFHVYLRRIQEIEHELKHLQADSDHF
ncbi:MAG: AraC family ligand binding domain-containing protein, partial [Bacteroidota bacterium]